MQTHQARRGLFILILLCCLAPVVASLLAYYVWTPKGGLSYGQLLATPLAAAQQTGWPQGRWVLLSSGDGCDEACQQRQFAMRQIRTAQGEAAERLVARHVPATSGLRADGFYLVDPRGNAVLFYPDGAKPGAIIREIGRVLKTNNGLG